MIYVYTFYTCVYDGENITCKMPCCITVASVWTRKLLVLILCLSIVDHPISVKYTYLACQNCTSIYVVLTTLTELPNQSTGDSPIVMEEIGRASCRERV